MRQKSAYLLVPVALTLVSCAQIGSFFEQPKPKTAHHKPAKTQGDVRAGSYVTTLSSTRLSLAANSGDTEAATNAAAAAKAYHTRKKATAETLTLAVIDYKQKGETQKIVTPVKGNFAALQTILNKLSGQQATLQNIKLISSTVTPDKDFTLPEDPEQLMAALGEQQQQLLAVSHPLPVAEDIKLQLELLGFFTRQRYQDAAYLTLDNTKRALAETAQNKTLDTASLNSYSTRLDALESTLKKELPYTL